MHVTDGCFSFLNKTKRKTCFVVGAKQFLNKPAILIVRFGEIRHEVLHVLLMDGEFKSFIIIGVKKGLILSS